MNNQGQGLFGALYQYWNIEPKARLHRRNTFFDDEVRMSNQTALKVGIVASVVATAIVFFWSIGGLFI